MVVTSEIRAALFPKICILEVLNAQFRDRAEFS